MINFNKELLLTTLLILMSTSTVIHAANIEHAGYFVGDYLAVGYDQPSDTAYKSTIKISRSTHDLVNVSDADTLVVSYFIGKDAYTGTISSYKPDDKQALLLETKLKSNDASKVNKSYCHYEHNPDSMSAEFMCYGSLTRNEKSGNNSFFVMKMN